MEKWDLYFCIILLICKISKEKLKYKKINKKINLEEPQLGMNRKNTPH